MKKHLENIAEACDGYPYTVRADGMQVVNGVEQDLIKIKDWIQMANQIFKSYKYFPMYLE